MTLIESDTAVVYPEIEYIDSVGNPRKKPAEVGVIVRCLITANTTSRRAASGTDAQIIPGGWSFQAKTAPLGHWSRIEWRGRTFTVSAGPAPVGPVDSAAHHIAASLIEER